MWFETFLKVLVGTAMVGVAASLLQKLRVHREHARIEGARVLQERQAEANKFKRIFEFSPLGVLCSVEERNEKIESVKCTINSMTRRALIASSLKEAADIRKERSEAIRLANIFGFRAETTRERREREQTGHFSFRSNIHRVA